MLDKTNNVFVGPQNYFKIVIDDFNGTAVKAWHIEDSKGSKTANLARGKGNHIDVLVSRANGTVGQFVGGMASQLYDAAQAEIVKLRAEASKAQTSGTETEKALAEKDTAVKRAQDAAKSAQEKAAQLEKTVKDLQEKEAARANYVPLTVPIVVAVVALIALVGLYLGLRRRPA
ncbi:MAG: hypothetical protein M1136_07415 [Chloroflexi bacterium]|nr:hypothetical protein [Chloroflexota bacterium]MCL5075462.1 hypothetical protein [Chloroflexota bacterium]